jgi:hypothetical protein
VNIQIASPCTAHQWLVPLRWTPNLFLDGWMSGPHFRFGYRLDLTGDPEIKDKLQGRFVLSSIFPISRLLPAQKGESHLLASLFARAHDPRLCTLQYCISPNIKISLSSHRAYVLSHPELMAHHSVPSPFFPAFRTVLYGQFCTNQAPRKPSQTSRLETLLGDSSRCKSSRYLLL